MRDNDLLQRKRKCKKRTTFSNHNLRIYPNIIKDVEPMRPNEIWVSDITYIQFFDKDYFLFLITDLYSHKVVGWCISENMATSNAISALEMALQQRRDKAKSLIHHSDRGSQYASYKYIGFLRKNKIMVSMTENGDPRENAVAERINGILKNEQIKYYSLDSIEIKQLVAKCIKNYNSLRPHLSLNYLTPDEAHRMEGKIDKAWRKKEYKTNKLENYE